MVHREYSLTIERVKKGDDTEGYGTFIVSKDTYRVAESKHIRGISVELEQIKQMLITRLKSNLPGIRRKSIELKIEVTD